MFLHSNIFMSSILLNERLNKASFDVVIYFTCFKVNVLCLFDLVYISNNA